MISLLNQRSKSVSDTNSLNSSENSSRILNGSKHDLVMLQTLSAFTPVNSPKSSILLPFISLLTSTPFMYKA